jgi:hypothetical protein
MGAADDVYVRIPLGNFVERTQVPFRQGVRRALSANSWSRDHGRAVHLPLTVLEQGSLRVVLLQVWVPNDNMCDCQGMKGLQRRKVASKSSSNSRAISQRGRNFQHWKITPKLQ